MRYAIIRDAVVETVIIWDGQSPYAVPSGCELVAAGESPVAPGYSYVNGEFVAPAAPAEEPAA